MNSVNDSGAPAERCSTLCGMCPACVFGPEPPDSDRCLWTVKDDLRRKFIVGLILRCTSVKVLQTIQEALRFTSWTLFNHVRSEIPSCIDVRLARTRTRASDGEPLGLDVNKIFDWFTSSSDTTKSRFILRLFSLCDSELLRMAANLTNVLLARQQQGLTHIDVSSQSTNQPEQSNDEDSENPALMVVPGSSKSMSGVSPYCDYISCLPGHLSKRILGLLDRQTLRNCQKICRTWWCLAQETMAERKLRRGIEEQIKAALKKYTRAKTVNPTYASFVEVPVPLKDEEDVERCDQQADIFKSAYAKIPTKLQRLEERNVYCGTYFTTVLLKREDPSRVVDYRNGPLMAVGSKVPVLHLFYVTSELKELKVLKGHAGSIRAVLICEDRDLVITGSFDSSIRCWDWKADKCVASLYGHSGAVNCLDLHGDKIVSGAKDHLVKGFHVSSIFTVTLPVWSLKTGKHVEKCDFKHPAPVQCVRINATTVYSSCARGLVKVWDLESRALIRVIDAHRNSVRCLFLDDLHLFSADVDGQAMAWSLSSDVKQCLMTFKHPKEVKSLTLVFLRVLTGCTDGKIRVFNFLTGECLKAITVEAENVGILSVHFHDNGILVNSKTRITHLQFAKVFWNYAAEGSQADAVAKPAGSLGKLSDPLEKLVSPRKKMDGRNVKKSDKSKQLHQSLTLPSSAKQAQDKGGSDEPSLLLSERASNERVKKRVPHHPLT
eukprot:XP_011601905.1 PREDICTED: CMT1A duplicated region transcript 1 protein [Takifugu rubripes]